MQQILIVDNDESLRKMLRLMLEKMGYGVTEAANGRKAEQMCAPKLPDLVMMDIFMPEQDGFQTIKGMRRAYPRLKIVAMTGYVRREGIDYLKIATMLGADRVLTKPFVRETLASALACLSPAA